MMFVITAPDGQQIDIDDLKVKQQNYNQMMSKVLKEKEMRLVTVEIHDTTVKFIRNLSPDLSPERPRFKSPSQETVVSVTMLISEIPDGDIEAMESEFQSDWQVAVKNVGLPVDIES